MTPKGPHALGRSRRSQRTTKNRKATSLTSELPERTGRVGEQEQRPGGGGDQAWRRWLCLYSEVPRALLRLVAASAAVTASPPSVARPARPSDVIARATDDVVTARDRPHDRTSLLD